jgi:hypothetical protein
VVFGASLDVSYDLREKAPGAHHNRHTGNLSEGKIQPDIAETAPEQVASMDSRAAIIRFQLIPASDSNS